MDSYSNKINRIKYTIDEIRDDIEKMKMVQKYLYIIIYISYYSIKYILQKNEKTISTMMTSINPKNANLNNFRSNEGDNMISNTANSLFQRNNYGIEKEAINEGITNNYIKYGYKNRNNNSNH